MPRYETVEQYRDRYWRKVLKKSTVRDLIIEKQIELDRVAEHCQKLRKHVRDWHNTVGEIIELSQEQIDLLGEVRTNCENIIKVLEKNNENLSNP